MSGTVIVLSDYLASKKKAAAAELDDDANEPWVEVFSAEGVNSTLQVYANSGEGEVEVVQLNDDSESIRTLLSLDEALELLQALQRFGLQRKGKGEKS